MSVHPIRTLNKFHMRHSEQCVQRAVEAIRNSMNSFEIADHEAVYCLSSGSPLPKDIEFDVFRADECGKEAMSRFMEDRLAKKDLSFHDPIRQQNLKIFVSTAK